MVNATGAKQGDWLLADVLADLADCPPGDIRVGGLAMDSRRVNPGDLYLALPGTRLHGAEFAAQVTAAGAAAILTDAAGEKMITDPAIPVIVVADPRLTMAEVAARFYRHPAEDMTTFAVTGTNGKTTTVMMLDQALRAGGRHTGTIGTLGFTIDGAELATARSTVTTPESPDLQALLRTMADADCSAMAMEVSSHALALHRTAGIVFDVVGFTNLGRDHLDFHPSVQDYFEAKARLFTTDHARCAVINSDDEHGRILIDRARSAQMDCFGIGFGPQADYRISRIRPDLSGSTFRLQGDGLDVQVTTCMPGEYNVRNAATALVMGVRAGVPAEDLLPGLATAVVPGRMQPVGLGPGAPVVYVDFAHTPQAITSALEAISRIGRIIVVVGAGGDRDPDKRPLMGRAAAAHADMVIVTDDNPRSEPPQEIRKAVLAGARQAVAEAQPGSRLSRVTVVDGGERRLAIAQALAIAGPLDAVAILGKGHERTQEIAGSLFEFDDCLAAQAMWAEQTRK